MAFKRIVNKVGHEMWYNNGKLCRWDEVPADIRAKTELSSKEEMAVVCEEMKEKEKEEQEALKKEANDRNKKVGGCLFCGDKSSFQRWLTDREVDLCYNCYHEKTIGEIKEQLSKE